MPLISILRFLFALLSLLILAACVYLLWTWHEGRVVVDQNGVLHLVKDRWRLWVGLALLVWSVFGHFALLPLIAHKDTEKSRPLRGAGRLVPSSTGSNLYVEEHGTPGAPVIIFTHGWSLDSTIWYYAKRQLAAEFHMIFWDLPGMGKSKAANGDAIGLHSFARDLQTIIGLADGRPVVLVGHSIGGMTIQTLARDFPQMFGREVSGVVLVNTTYTNPLQTMILSGLMQALRKPLLEPMMYLTIWLQPLVWLSAWQSYVSGSAHLANRLAFGRFVTRSQLRHTTLLSTRNPPGNIARGNLAMFGWDATDALKGIDVPVLVVGGELDIITKPQASAVIANEHSPASELHVIDGVNHMGFLERAKLYNDMISTFAKGL